LGSKTDGGFPEAKILKQKVRNCIEPGKNLGHSDTPSAKAAKPAVVDAEAERQSRESTIVATQRIQTAKLAIEW